jgi:hypothetical protein
MHLARRNPIGPHEKSAFTEESLKILARDLKNGRLPLERTIISDDRMIGLRAMVTKDGRVTFHASYHYGNKRPFMMIGELTDDRKNPDRITIEDAREITKTIKYLGDMGIDPQEGLQRRLVAELKRDGTKWRPKN